MDPALLSAEDLMRHYRQGTLTPLDALHAVTERIARRNPAVNAFAALDPRALAAAGQSAQRWAAGRPVGPLDGAPCTVKDLVDVAGLPTRRGSRTTPDRPAETDAPLAAGLRAAGAVIVGKTTTTEFGWKTPGDCPLHGITRNPWDLARTPGGSSAGAAAAAAAGFAPLHVGTDAGGSIRIPAAWCGVVGLKPTFGRVPQWPLGAFASVAVAGPITRTVRDAALMLGAMARFDWRDPYCLNEEPRDWLAGIEDGVEGMRVAVLRGPGFDAPVESEGIAAVEQAAQALADAGAELQEVDPGLPDTGRSFALLWSAALRLLVQDTPAEQRGLLEPALLALAERPEPSATAMMRAAALQVSAAHAMARLHQRFELVLCPSVPEGPPLAGSMTNDPVQALLTQWAPWTLAFNLTRQPAMSVPMGLGAGGMPRSVQVAAAIYRDDLVLRAGRVIEQGVPQANQFTGPRK